MDDNGDDEMLMEILVPQNPMVDPLAVNDYTSNLQGSCSQVISLDSSSDEEVPMKIASKDAKDSSVPTTLPNYKVKKRNSTNKSNVNKKRNPTNKSNGNPLAQIKSVIGSIESSVNTKIGEVLGNTKSHQLKLANKWHSRILEIKGPEKKKLANLKEVEKNTIEDFEMDIPVKKFILYKLDSSKKGLPEQTTTDSIPPLATKHKITQGPYKSCPSNDIGIQSSNPPGFDLNVSISNTMTTNAIQNSNSQWALGLVLNVNEANNSSPGVSNNPVGLNNVALDVSVNMNNRCKEPSPLSAQATLYCCSGCAYKSTDLETIKNHICPNSVSNINQASQITESQGNSVPLQSEKMYVCSVCSYKTSNINDISSHICKNTEIVTSTNNLPIIVPKPSKETIYRCSWCTWQTNNINLVGCHICPSKKNLERGRRKINKETTPQPKEQPQINITNKKYSCASCSLESNTMSTIINHKCQNPSWMQKFIKKDNIYTCIVCSFAATDLKYLGNHRCLKNAKTQSMKSSPNTNQTYRCLECNYQTMVKNNFINRICPAINSSIAKACVVFREPPFKEICSLELPSDQNIIDKKSRKMIYSCTGCSYRTNTLEQMNTHSLHCKNLEPVEQPNEIKTGVYYCGMCSCNSTDPDIVKFHICSMEHNETLKHKQVSEKPSKKQPSKFTCLSCGFTVINTSIPDQIKTHKCQTRSRKGRKEFTCEMCYIKFFDTRTLFKHMMETHYTTKKIWTCKLCKLKTNFYSAEELEIHLSLHVPPYPEIKHSYECTFCHVILEPKDVKDHLKFHVTWDFAGELDELFENFQDSLLKDDNQQSNFIKKCYSCYKDIDLSVLPGIKCVNSDCENWYHVHCCNNYSEKLEPHDISNHPDWFCINCNDKLVQHNATKAEENVGVIGFCLDVVDTLFLEQANKQKSMLEEICKIKEEKLATKEEFKRVKDFIVNSKSEKINTPMARAVCDVIERFINAGVDDANS